MMVLYNIIAVVEYGERRPGIHSAPVVMEHNNNRDHIDIASHSSKHTKHIPYSHILILTHSHKRTVSLPHLHQFVRFPPGIYSNWPFYLCRTIGG